ncbi:MAG: hypothetical protein AAFX76_12160 [Planctomycetota bacterium]
MPPAEPSGGGGYRRAAIAMWVSGSLLLLGSVCCVSSVALFAVVPLDELRSMEGMDQIPAEEWEQVETAQPFLLPTAIFLAALTLLPAIVMVVLAFGVAAGKRGTTKWALGVTIVPLVVVGGMAALSLVGGGLANAVLPLALAGALGWCVWALKRALDEPEPWDAGGPYDPGYPGAGVGSPGAGLPGAGLPGAGVDDPWERSL